MMIPTKKFLNRLVERSIISKDDANKYEVESLQRNLPIDDYLLSYTKIDKGEILSIKSELISVPWVDLTTIPIAPQALSLVPESVARKYNLIPFEVSDIEKKLKVAMENPLDLEAIEFLEKKTALKIIPSISLKADIVKAVEISYAQGLSPDVVAALKEVEPTVRTIKAEEIADLIKEAPIAKIVSTILEYAIRSRASDVHIEPQEVRTRVRY